MLRWKITQDSVAYNGLTFDIHYTVSDYIQADLVRYSIYDGVGCSASANFITQLDYFNVWVTEDDTPVGGGLGTRNLTLSTQINTETIAQSSVYTDSGTEGLIVFCMRLSLFDKNTSDPTAVEVNHYETAINLRVDLTDQFNILGQSVEAADRGEETANDEFFVESFICTPEGLRIYEAVTFVQGTNVRVCVQPTPQAIGIGFRMRSIDRFTFWQGYVSQEAVTNQVVAVNGLTDLQCNTGDEQCMFETLLVAFQGPSTVGGTGVATLQFGSGAPGGRRRRNLRQNITDDTVKSHRELQGRQKELQLEKFQIEKSQLRPHHSSAGGGPRGGLLAWFLVPCVVLAIQAMEPFL